MARYEVVFDKSVSRDLRPIPSRDVRRILDAFRSLAENARPFQSQKLSGQEKYRLRVGIYRILYRIDDSQRLVYVVKIAHRKDAYRA